IGKTGFRVGKSAVTKGAIVDSKSTIANGQTNGYAFVSKLSHCKPILCKHACRKGFKTCKSGVIVKAAPYILNAEPGTGHGRYVSSRIILCICIREYSGQCRTHQDAQHRRDLEGAISVECYQTQPY